MNMNGKSTIMLLLYAALAIVSGSVSGAALLPNGVARDDRTSIAYDPNTGELALDVPVDIKLADITIVSAAEIFNPEQAKNIGVDMGGSGFDVVNNQQIFKAAIGTPAFGSLSFGFVAPAGLNEDFVLYDLAVTGVIRRDRPALGDPAFLGEVDLIYGPISESGIFLDEGILQAGDADEDLDFDQLDLVQVQIAAKFLSAEPATWGQGDWDGAPGGGPGDPPPGDGRFDQRDIVAALLGAAYLQGPYAALQRSGATNDDQTSLVYYASSGELAVDAPAGRELTSINISSASGIFTGEAAQNLGGDFDNDADDNIFKATFGSSFGSLSFGNVAQTGLSEDLLSSDLTVVGSLAGGGGLGDVDLVYIPEPATALLLCVGILVVPLTRFLSR